MRHLSVAARAADPIRRQVLDLLDDSMLVDDLDELVARLQVATTSRDPATLDLIGHSTHGSLLQLGTTVVDGNDPDVVDAFARLAATGVLARLGVVAIRLLGCSTAMEAGRATICALADATGVEVFGTTGPVFVEHYDCAGFRDDHRFLLRSARELRANPMPSTPRRRFVLADLPCVSTAQPDVVEVTPAVAAELCELVVVDAGGLFVGPPHVAELRLAVPSSPGRYHLLEVLLGGTFVRDGAGVLFPVSDSAALAAVITASTRSARRLRST